MLRHDTRTRRRLRPAVTALVAAWLPAAAVMGCTAPKAVSPVVETATGERVERSYSVLKRTERGIKSRFSTLAEPRHAYTLWYVIFNAPEHCSDGVCGDDDIFADPSDHSAGFNVPQIRKTRASSLWAGDGAVANRRGRVRLRGSLRVGKFPRGPAQVVVGRPGDGALAPVGVVTGLEDVKRAVILAVLQDHGRAHTDRKLRRQQLTSFQGACNPRCSEPQVAMHAP